MSHLQSPLTKTEHTVLGYWLLIGRNQTDEIIKTTLELAKQDTLGQSY